MINRLTKFQLFYTDDLNTIGSIMNSVYFLTPVFSRSFLEALLYYHIRVIVQPFLTACMCHTIPSCGLLCCSICHTRPCRKCHPSWPLPSVLLILILTERTPILTLIVTEPLRCLKFSMSLRVTRRVVLVSFWFVACCCVVMVLYGRYR